MIRTPTQLFRQTVSSVRCHCHPREYGKKYFSTSKKSRLLLNHNDKRITSLSCKEAEYSSNDNLINKQNTNTCCVGKRLISSSRHFANNEKGKAIFAFSLAKL